MSDERSPQVLPEPEVDPITGRQIYRMGRLDQFALIPEIPKGAKVTVYVLRDRSRSSSRESGQ